MYLSVMQRAPSKQDILLGEDKAKFSIGMFTYFVLCYTTTTTTTTTTTFLLLLLLLLLHFRSWYDRGQWNDRYIPAAGVIMSAADISISNPT